MGSRDARILNNGTLLDHFGTSVQRARRTTGSLACAGVAAAGTGVAAPDVFFGEEDEWRDSLATGAAL